MLLCQCLLQNYKTPVHLAAHLGHVEVLKILIQGYHADKMVKAIVSSKCIVSTVVYLYMCLYMSICIRKPASLTPA